VQVVSSVFDLMETYHERWRGVTAAQAVPLFGFPHGVGLEPVNVDVSRMLAIFRQAARDLREIWQAALTPVTLADVEALVGQDSRAFVFPEDLWVRVVWDFAVAYKRRVLPQEALLRSLVPLYLGRTGSFVLRTADAGAEEVETIIQDLAESFLRDKGYLLQRWSGKAAEA